MDPLASQNRQSYTLRKQRIAETLCHLMNYGMSGASHNFKIFWAVVALPAVPVMNNFVAPKRPTNHTLADYNVLLPPLLIVHFDSTVSIFRWLHVTD